jgi:hypothetical protein
MNNRGKDPEKTTPKICSIVNANKVTLEPTEVQVSKASICCEALSTRPSVSGLTSTADLLPLQKSLENSEMAIMMSQKSQSALDSAREYQYTGESDDTLDCFGYSMGDDLRYRMLNVPQMPRAIEDLPILEEGRYFDDVFKGMDELLTGILKNADKVVISSANLMKWTSSKQLCCYVYLTVLLSTLSYRIYKFNKNEGSFCHGKTTCSQCGGTGCKVCNFTGEVSEFIDTEQAIINELRWASNVRNTEGLKNAIKLIQILKQIIDIFNNKSKHLIFIAGIRLPLSEMWEMIKLVISNALAQYLDLLFGPIDRAIASMKGVPDVRHMINNECFGFGDFLNFLQCLLGNLKYGIINEIMKHLDFTMNDFTIINDIYLCRQRLAFLEALSNLFDNILGLLIGLKDCYDPETIVDKIIQKQQEDQYNKLEKYTDLMGADIPYADEVSRSLMQQTATFNSDEIAELDSMPGSVSRQMQGVGQDAIFILAKEVPSFDTHELKISKFIGEDGKLLDIGRINEIMEEQTGISTRHVKESMESIIAILEGNHANT